MARKRFITSGMSNDEDIAEIAEKDTISALMWPWFITSFDDWGRMEVTSARQVKLDIFPAFSISTDTIEKAIIGFDMVGIAYLYEIDGRRYLAIEPCKYYKYQTYIKEIKRNNDNSKFPPPINPPWENCAHCRAPARTCADSRAPARLGVPSPSPSPSINNSSGCSKAEGEGKVYQVFNGNIGPITQFQSELIGQWLDEGFDPDMLTECILDSLGAGNKWTYLKAKIEACGAKNVKTLEQYINDKQIKKAGDGGNAWNNKQRDSGTNTKPVSGIGIEV